MGRVCVPIRRLPKPMRRVLFIIPFIISFYALNFITCFRSSPDGNFTTAREEEEQRRKRANSERER